MSRPVIVDKAHAPGVATAHKWPVCTVVLAGGLGRRMPGQNKLLLELAGQAVVRWVVQAALASASQRVLVVLGYEAERIRAVLSDLPVQFVHNPQYAEGMASSVRAGADRVADHEAVLICLGDMPLVDTAVMDALINAWQADPSAGACQPEFEGRRGNPVLWSPRFLPDLRALEGDQGARLLLKHHPDQVRAVKVNTPGIYLDIDSPPDFDKVLACLAAGSACC